MTKKGKTCNLKTISFSELCYSNINFEITDIFFENWLQRKEFSLYKNQERPCSALFFVCSEIEVSFFSADDMPDMTAKNGDVVFIPKGIRYFVRVLGDVSRKFDTYTVNLHFYDERHNEFLLQDRIAVLTHFSDHRSEMQLKKLCDTFHRAKETSSGEKYNLAKINGEFFLLLDLIGTSVLQNDDFYYPIKKGAEIFCEEWNQNEKIEKYAQLSGVSVTYFYRCFRRWSGSTPIEYRNMLRLSNAESMLRCTDMKIKEISELIGFEDPFYFCRIFSQKFGASPQKYRKKFRSREK